MTNARDLMKKAQDLKAKAERVDDPKLRDRLGHMAQDYARLAEGEAQKDAHPVDAAALGDILTKGG